MDTDTEKMIMDKVEKALSANIVTKARIEKMVESLEKSESMLLKIDMILHQELEDTEYSTPENLLALLETLGQKVETYFSSPDTVRGRKIMERAQEHFYQS
jgi:hypothetical protein